MIISADMKNSIEKIQHSFMMKLLSKLGLEGSTLNLMNVVYLKMYT